MSTPTRLAAALLGVCLAGGLTACGSSGGSGSPATGASSTGSSSTGSSSTGASSTQRHPVKLGASVSGPCDVTDQATVAAVFAGARKGSPGQARNCEYLVGSGAIKSVNVFYYGSSSDWDAEKAQAKEYAAPLKDVAIGDGAYYAAKGGGAVTVRKGGIIFAVQALPNGFPSAAFFTAHEAQVEALATRIAAQH